MHQGANTDNIDVTLLIPCKNEEANVCGALNTAVAALKEIGCSYELLVVDDGSIDHTAEVVDRYRSEHPDVPIILHRNPRNFGLSRTFVDGAFAGRGKYFRVLAGDDCEPKDTLVEILRHMGKADIVIPYHRAHPGSALRIAISRFYTFLVNRFSGYNLHYYNGNPLLRRDQVMRWHSYAWGFGFQADLLTRLLDERATYVEVPIIATRREKGGAASYLKLRNFVSTAHTLYEILRRRLNQIAFDGRRW